MTEEVGVAPVSNAGKAGVDAVLISAREVRASFPIYTGLLRRTTGNVAAIDGVDLDIDRGETLGLVGESGCGKSSLGRALIGLIRLNAGRVLFDGIDIGALGSEEMRQLRARMQIIFQDPVGSLNPRMTVRDSVAEGLIAHGVKNKSERRDRVCAALEQVGLGADMLARYPHELSGGQRQRVGIARALVLNPQFIVADESVSALDVSVQAQVLNLLADLKQRLSLTYLFISHDLAVVDYLSDRIAVMYLGKLMEVAPGPALRDRPLHPYTVALMSSAMVDSGLAEPDRRIVLSGEIPKPESVPAGCRFRTRCPIARPICASEEPELTEAAPGHYCACHFPGELTW